MMHYNEGQQISQEPNKINDALSQNCSWTNDEIDRMVMARLDLPVVSQLRKSDINMSIIR
jgi:hypothetical protein